MYTMIHRPETMNHDPASFQVAQHSIEVPESMESEIDGAYLTGTDSESSQTPLGVSRPSSSFQLMELRERVESP